MLINYVNADRTGEATSDPLINCFTMVIPRGLLRKRGAYDFRALMALGYTALSDVLPMASLTLLIITTRREWGPMKALDISPLAMSAIKG